MKGRDAAAKSYRVLRAILNTAVDDDLVTRNPCRIKGGGTETPAERPMVATETVLALSGSIDPRYRALVLLGGFGGLRTGEMLGLRRRHVDQLHGTVTVAAQAQELKSLGRTMVAPKSEAGRRVVAIPATLATELQEHMDRFAQPGADGFVFTGPAGTPLRRATLSAAWRSALVVATAEAGDGVEFPADLHVHDLRHHAATMMARTPGVTTKELMVRIGHASPRAALIYQHATEERDRAVSDYLEGQMQAAKRQRTEKIVDLACHPRVMGASSAMDN